MLCITLLAQPCVALVNGSLDRRSRPATVTVWTARRASRFISSHALGAGVDGQEKGEVDLQLRPENIKLMLSAGLKSLTYRLRTELGVEVWHWNSRGTWSNPAGKQGYWISDSASPEPISLSFGYALPRRGNTIDQANNKGYSRLDDGDTESVWKSNPYLDLRFTHESNALHQQWVVIEFAAKQKVNALRLLWGTPFAIVYRIQYADLDDISDIALSPPGMWHDFPGGVVRRGSGGEVFLRLSSAPIETRFVRVLLERSSNTAPPGATDIRDGLGYALREIYAGYLDQNGKFQDQIRRGTDRQSQTLMHVSSTDPWHREVDLDENVEQPGLDRIFQSGLTNGLPMLTPGGLLYDTPENAANEVRYLRSRGYSFERIELGEEPDGQYATPEDFGALYLQWAEAIHTVDPNLKLGGPSFQEIEPDTTGREYRFGNSGWMRRFLKYLRARGRLHDYNFFSFEWYPFDDVCQPVAPQLARATNMLTEALSEMQRGGVTHHFPWIMSEYGFSAFGARAEISIEGALFNADVVGRFLTLGGDQAFLYGYTPSQPLTDQCTAGNNMLFSMGSDGNIRHRFATYFGARLLAQEWLSPAAGWHEIYPATTNVPHKLGETIVTAYAVHRPDRFWSLLLVNKDPEHSYKVQVRFRNRSTQLIFPVAGPLDLFQYSAAQYVLNDDKLDPYPIKADPPSHTVLLALDANSIELPANSLTVLRGPSLVRRNRGLE